MIGANFSIFSTSREILDKLLYPVVLPFRWFSPNAVGLRMKNCSLKLSIHIFILWLPYGRAIEADFKHLDPFFLGFQAPLKGSVAPKQTNKSKWKLNVSTL